MLFSSSPFSLLYAGYPLRFFALCFFRREGSKRQRCSRWRKSIRWIELFKARARTGVFYEWLHTMPALCLSDTRVACARSRTRRGRVARHECANNEGKFVHKATSAAASSRFFHPQCRAFFPPWAYTTYGVIQNYHLDQKYSILSFIYIKKKKWMERDIEHNWW